MSSDQVVQWLRGRYSGLEPVRPSVFRAIDRHDGTPFAVRFFDIEPNLQEVAGNISQYQEELLGEAYFDARSSPNLRWNYYIYFVTEERAQSADHLDAKRVIEANREFARKVVVDRESLGRLLTVPSEVVTPDSEPVGDPLASWIDSLEDNRLAFVVDEALSVPDVAREVEEGSGRPLVRAMQGPALSPSESAVPNDALRSLTIRGFRPFPSARDFEFGRVNLIQGVNGVGKTSLLEAIEFLFCGKTLRQGPLLPKTAVTAVLERSGLSLETKSTTPAAVLRARNLSWYGKSELRAVTLHESFAKFNFLDADAAVRLSVDQSREQLTEDLAQLLLGSEASKVLDRCERVSKQLETRKGGLDESIVQRTYRRADATKRLEELKKRPRKSDQLFNDLVGALAKARVRVAPRTKDAVSDVATRIDTVLLACERLGAASTVLTDTVNDETTVGLQRTVEELARIQLREQARLRAVATGESRRKAAEALLQAIREATEILDGGLPQILKQRTASLQRIGQIEPGILEAVEGVESLVADLPRKRSLADVVAHCQRRVVEGGQQVQAIRSRLEDVERSQTVMRTLRQRLSAAAQEVISKSDHLGRCPVCGAQYEPHELEAKMNDAFGAVVSQEAARVRAELSVAEEAARIDNSRLASVLSLSTYLNESARTLSLSQAVAKVASDLKERSEAEKELGAVDKTLRSLAQRGWTGQRWADLVQEVGGTQGAATRAFFEQRFLEVEHELGAARKAVADAVEQGAVLAELVARLCEGQGLSARDVSHALIEIEDRMSALRRTQDALLEINRVLDLAGESGITAAECRARLQRARTIAVELRVAIEDEQSTAEDAQREMKLVQELDDDLSGLRVRLDRVEQASRVINSLLEQQTERRMTEDVLQQNASRIAFAFGRIHSPNEFDIATDNGFHIVRRGAGNVELTEMSSGQRAAYALSLFLAMNSRLSSGPNILLFDDPIAHVDDINTLSFLDYLRDLALMGKRQIFFATADAKIASLFVRKFGFLGDAFREISLARA